MNNSKSGLVGILSFIALTAASLGILGVASRSADAAPVSRAPVAVVRDAAAPTVSVVWTIDEVTVTPRAKRPAAKKASVIETSSDICIVRPSDAVYGTTVRTCTPADMIGQ